MKPSALRRTIATAVWGSLFFVHTPSARAQLAPTATEIAQSPPIDKSLNKELSRGKLIDAIERRKPRKAYLPPERLLLPYATATLSAPVAYEISEGTEFADATEAQQLCQEIVDKLIEKWNGPHPNIKVYITAEDSFHGEVRPSGVILISLGVFNKNYLYGATSTEELTLLLAHELSHMLLGHLDDQKMMNSVADSLSLVSNTYMAYGHISESYMVGDEFKAKSDPRIIRRGLIANLTSQTLIRDLLRPSFGRGKELEADRLAIDLAVRAEIPITEGVVGEFVNHHAADQAQVTGRMAALATVLRALNEENASQVRPKIQVNSTFLSDIFQNATREIGNQAINGTLLFISSRNKDHPDPAERLAFDQSYFRQNYPPKPQPETSSQPVRRKPGDTRFLGVANANTVAPLVDRVNQAAVARKGLVATISETDAAKSDAAIRQVLKDAGLQNGAAPDLTNQVKAQDSARKSKAPSRPTQANSARPMLAGFGDDKAAITWSMEGLLRDIEGNRGLALAAWRRGLATSMPSVDVAARWARGLPPDLRASALPPVLDRYGKLLGTSDPILDLVVAAAVAKGDTAQAETKAAQCMNYRDGKLYPSCVQYLGYDPTNKETPAQTPEGQSAFQAKGLGKTVQWLKPLGDIF